jgi:hypothetical protein
MGRIGCGFLKVVSKLGAKAQTQNSYPDARVSEMLDGRRHGLLSMGRHCVEA